MSLEDNVLNYISQVTQSIIDSRQITLPPSTDDDHQPDTHTHNSTAFDLELPTCDALRFQLDDQHLNDWHLYKSSLALTVNICMHSRTRASDLIAPSQPQSQPQLIEQWKIIFNQMPAYDHADDAPSIFPADENMEHRMSTQLRSLLTFLRVLPVHRILPPQPVLHAMDLIDYNLVHSFPHPQPQTPFELSYQLYSVCDRGPSDSEQKSAAQKLQFHGYDEVDCFTFPALECASIGTLQTSVFYVNGATFDRLYIDSNAAMQTLLARHSQKRALIHRYLGFKFNELCEEQQQRKIAIDAVTASQAVGHDAAEEDDLYADENDYENDKMLNDQKMMPKKPFTEVESENDANGLDQKMQVTASAERQQTTGYKMGKLFDRVIESVETSSKQFFAQNISIAMPRPCNLCVQILTPYAVKIAWKADKALKGYDASTNVENEKFKFEVRSKRVLAASADPASCDIDEEKVDATIADEVDIHTLIDDRAVTIHETFAECMTYHCLHAGRVYKFQVRMIDRENTLFMSKWSSTISALIPDHNFCYEPCADLPADNDRDDSIHDSNSTVENSNSQKKLHLLHAEELRDLCSTLMQTTQTQRDQIDVLGTDRERLRSTLALIENEKSEILRQLNTIQRSLRIKSNRYNESDAVAAVNAETEGEADHDAQAQLGMRVREQIPNVNALAKEWLDLKLDVHLKLFVYLCRTCTLEATLAYQVLFEISMQCYREMLRQQQVLGDFESDDHEECKEIDSHRILMNMDIFYHNPTSPPSTSTSVVENGDKKQFAIYRNYCHRVVDTVKFNALRDPHSKWFKYTLFANEHIEFALNDYICECCRIIWCLLSLSVDDTSYQYELHPTKFRAHKLNKPRGMKLIDMEFGVDDYDDDAGDASTHSQLDDDVICIPSIMAKQAMETYDGDQHKREMGSVHNATKIEFCSWPCIVKVHRFGDSKRKEAAAASSLFGRLDFNDDKNKNNYHVDGVNEQPLQYLTRAFVFCSEK